MKTGCVNGKRKCQFLGRQYVSDMCGQFHQYLTSQETRCDECKKTIKLEDIVTRSGKAVWK